MSVQEIEVAVSHLSATELARFSEWYEEFMAARWEAQIAADSEAGRLDAPLREADGHYEGGRCTPL